MSGAPKFGLSRRVQDVREALRMALATVRGNKLRSFLTILGVFIGVTSVIAMGSCIEGLNQSMAKQISTLGTHTIRVRRFPPFRTSDLPDSLRQRKFFDLEDVEGIRRTAPAVGDVSILMLDFEGDRVRWRGHESNMISVWGADEAFPRIHEIGIERGRFFTGSEIEHRMKVCVIGTDIVDALFPGVDPIGHRVVTKGNQFQVIGVFAKRGKFLGETQDDLFLVPYTTFEKLIDSRRMLIDARPADPAMQAVAIDQIIDSLRRTRGVSPDKPNDFEIFTSDQLMDTYKQLTSAFYLVMILISSIALMVGGIGVMNIMLVSVTERTREIGIRKAIGARRGDIQTQFLLEAVTLTGFGGIMGIVVGAGAGQLVKALTPLPSDTPAWIMAAGFSVSVGVGLIFGIWPAMKAARLNPVDALRYE